jgi:hypothetical protein
MSCCCTCTCDGSLTSINLSYANIPDGNFPDASLVLTVRVFDCFFRYDFPDGRRIQVNLTGSPGVITFLLPDTPGFFIQDEQKQLACVGGVWTYSPTFAGDIEIYVTV